VDFAGTSHVDYPEIRPSDSLRAYKKLHVQNHRGKECRSLFSDLACKM